VEKSTLLGFMGFQNAKVYVPCSIHDGVTKRCRDYEGRPDICREFFCEKAKEAM
jgi:Fe-S-cluster containining protein